MTDCDKILSYMKRNGHITPADAFSRLGIYRLSARIFDLREKGHHIITDIIEDVNAEGDKVHYASYRFGEDERYDL